MFIALELTLLLMVVVLSSQTPHAAPSMVLAEGERSQECQPGS